MEIFTQFAKQLETIQGWSNVALTLAACVVIGYVLRVSKRFPNDGIPVVAILTGGVAMMLLADPRSVDVPSRVWHTRNCLIGLTLGFIAWMGHKLIVSRLEDWLASKFAFVAKLLDISPGSPVSSRPADQLPPDAPKMPTAGTGGKPTP